MSDALKTRVLGLMRRGGAYICEESGHYALRLHPDRRRKALLNLTVGEFKAAFEGTVLHRRQDGCLTLLKSEVTAKNDALPKTKPFIEDPILYLRALKSKDKQPLFSDSHLKALYQLMRDHAHAYGAVHLTLNWDRLGMPQSGSAHRDMDTPLWRIAKQKEVRKAFDCLGPLSELFERLCLEGTSHSLANGVWGLPDVPFFAKIAAALDRLVDFYGQP